MVDKQKIGSLMATLRRKKNLTQAELAELLNVSNKSISRWENGSTLPDYDQVLDLCAILDVGVADFLSGHIADAEEVPAPEPPVPEPEQEETAPEQPEKRKRSVLFAVLAAAALLLTGVLITVAVRSAQKSRIAIDETNFPDEAFLRFVDRTVAHSHSGSFTKEELLAVTALDCSQEKIADLTGLALFENLESLDCSGNAITQLDLSGNRALLSLACGENALSTLDLSVCPALTSVNCEGNELSSLDVSHNPALTALKCNDNRIAGIDVRKNPKLADLQCYCNPIGNIDVSQNPELEKLDAWEVGFTTLDVSNNPKLTYLNCDYSALTSLNLSNNPELEVLYCAFNQLTSLDLGIQSKIRLLSCGNNALETLILNDDMPLEILLCNVNRLLRLDLSAYSNLNYCICCQNSLSELTLASDMLINVADADRFRIDDSVMLATYALERNGDGYRFDLGQLVSPQNMDRVTVRTKGASQPDENGTVTFDTLPRELVYVFDTGYHHIGCEVRIILEPAA